MKLIDGSSILRWAKNTESEEERERGSDSEEEGELPEVPLKIRQAYLKSMEKFVEHLKEEEEDEDDDSDSSSGSSSSSSGSGD